MVLTAPLRLRNSHHVRGSSLRTLCCAIARERALHRLEAGAGHDLQGAIIDCDMITRTPVSSWISSSARDRRNPGGEQKPGENQPLERCFGLSCWRRGKSAPARAYFIGRTTAGRR